MVRWCCIAGLVVMIAMPVMAQSVFPMRPEDPSAVYLQNGTFGASADGKADDSPAIQAAIDHVQETTGQGIVFVAEGRYRISRTIHLWAGIRLVGYGAHRPTFFLAAKTSGFQNGHEFLGTGRYMLQFASYRPAVGGAVVDANEFTFYSGISNVDFEIGEGNPAAIAVRFHVAQHSFLQHMRFQVGSGRAALEDVGNGAHDLQIEGGDYGIISVRTSPAWQFLLMDSSLTGQRRAAIHTQEVGMTLIRDRIAHTPIAVEVTPGMTEQLYARDLDLEDISESAVVTGDTGKAHHQVTLDHIVCRNVRRLVQGTSGSDDRFSVRGSSHPYIEEHLTIGVSIGPDGRERGVEVEHRERAATGTTLPSDVPRLPAMQDWINVRSLGVKGDGSDDTEALQAAINGHRILYFPSGTYRVTDTLRLRADSVMIGFHPSTTRISVTNDSTRFTGDGDAVPVIESAEGGAAILTGIGISTGTLDHRAAGLVWRAGRASLVDDVNFGIGFARRIPTPGPTPPRQPQIPPVVPMGLQYPSLWVKDGGGGIFRGIWTANSLSKDGLLVENTTTPSVVYQMSCEHHLKHETQFQHASNWTVYALQTEEENPAGAESFAVDLMDAHHMLFANLFMYRVSRNVMPKLNAVEALDSTDVRFENLHNFSQTRLAFDNSVFDSTSGVRVRTHDFTAFTIGPALKAGPELLMPASAIAPGTRLEVLSSGFSNVSGLTTDGKGDLYFTDAALHRIYRWDPDAKKAHLLTDQVPTPIAAGFVADRWLLVPDYSRTVFVVDTSTGKVTKLEASTEPASGTSLMFPVGFHNGIETLKRQIERRGVIYAPRSNMAIVANVENETRGYFYAPGSRTALMAGGDWQPVLQSSQWQLFHLGDEHFAVNEEDDAVYRLRFDSVNRVTATQFASRGGSSVVTDASGNVYVADGQIYIYDAKGKQIGIVEIPERPSSLAFGENDKKTLFIGARRSLYSLRTIAAGR